MELRIAGVLLAAGLSRRMGAVNKLLLPVDGRPMVRRSSDILLEAGASPLVVVTGHMHVEIAAAVGQADVVLNPRFAEGMGTSLAAGVAALPDGLSGFFVALADMPFVRPDTLRAMMKAFGKATPGTICLPTYKGRRGNPVLFADVHREALTHTSGDRGARDYLTSRPECTVDVPVDDAGVVRDIDSPDSLAAAGLRTQEGSS